MTSLSFCRFRFIAKMWVYHFVGLNSYRHWKTMNFVVTLHQFSTIRALLLCIFHKGQCNMCDILPQKSKPALIKNSNTKTNGRNRSVVLVTGYCKVSHVVFIILVVQIFCLKCIYHFAGLLFSYLSFCRFTLLNIQKVVSFSWVIIFEVCFLIISPLESIIFLGNHFPG